MSAARGRRWSAAGRRPRLGAQTGHTITVQPEIAGIGGPIAAAGSARLTIVGVYEAGDPAAGYWAGREYVTGGDVAAGREVLFITSETAAWLPYGDALETVDLVPHAATFTDPGRLRQIISSTAEGALVEEADSSSGIPALLDRVAASRRTLTTGVGVAVVPLVLLCWLVLYLAVTNSAFRRRSEAGLSGLRGVPGWTRWWLSVAEYLVPMLLGAPLGLLLGWLAVTALSGTTAAGWLLPPGADGDGHPAGAGLRRGGGGRCARGGRGRPVAGDRRTGGHAAAPGARPARRGAGRPGRTRRGDPGRRRHVPAEHRRRPGRRGGPAGPDAHRAGGRAARGAPGHGRRGRAGPAGPAPGRAAPEGWPRVLVARQPGQARLLGLFVVLFALLGFAVTAADVAARARAERVTAELGAARVLDVRPVPARQLLSAVRAADPTGRYAMAVARLPGDGPPVLAVDSTRLARVATWSGRYGMSATRAAGLLRPASPDPVRVSGTGVRLEVAVTGPQPAGIRLVVRLQPQGDGGAIERTVPIRPGVGTYRCPRRAAVPGCRLIGIAFQGADHPRYDVALTLREVRQTGPDAVVVGAAQLADPGALAARRRRRRQPAHGHAGRGRPAVGVRAAPSGRRRTSSRWAPRTRCRCWPRPATGPPWPSATTPRRPAGPASCGWWPAPGPPGL